MTNKNDAPAGTPLIIDLQSACPSDWTCYECKDGNHTKCVGAPCHCKCEQPVSMESKGVEDIDDALRNIIRRLLV